MLTSVSVTASSFLFINGCAFLIPAWMTTSRMSLPEAALLASMPSWGMVCTLILWGYLTDRYGERLVMTAGSALTGAAALCAALAHSSAAVGGFLFVGGMAAASSNTAGGSLVSGWFPSDRRGLAMGIRQTAQPLGIALGALLIPAFSAHSPRCGLLFFAAACVVASLGSAIGVVDPPRRTHMAAGRPRVANPYRGSYLLWRIHIVSALLMMPQTVTATFMLLWLVRGHGWSAVAAGAAVTCSQLLGAVGRIVVGRWSDLIGSRMGLVRIIAIGAAATLFALSLLDLAESSDAVLMMIAVSVIAVLDNGLEAAAITELAGPLWSGRALGVQNTAQRLMAAGASPLFADFVVAARYPTAWALCALFPLLAILFVPGSPDSARSNTARNESDDRDAALTAGLS